MSGMFWLDRCVRMLVIDVKELKQENINLRSELQSLNAKVDCLRNPYGAQGQGHSTRAYQ